MTPTGRPTGALPAEPRRDPATPANATPANATPANATQPDATTCDSRPADGTGDASAGDPSPGDATLADAGLLGRRRHDRRRRGWDVLGVVAAGGGLGSVGRYLLESALPTLAPEFPWTTLLINVSGSFALGCLVVYVLSVWPPSRYARPFLGIGLLGGYTTFSTYAGETRQLAAAGRWPLAAAYAIGSLLAGLLAVWLGAALARFATAPGRRRRLAHRYVGGRPDPADSDR